MRDDDPRHGTYAGAVRHRKDWETACNPCKAAAAAYQRNRRATRPEVRAKEAAATNARTRALWRLAARHRDEFVALVDDEMGRRDVA